LKRHLLDKLPVSDLCEDLSLKPTVFYRWQKEFFQNSRRTRPEGGSGLGSNGGFIVSGSHNKKMCVTTSQRVFHREPPLEISGSISLC
jgi:hypothetical protein